jgi:hypothetical protein
VCPPAEKGRQLLDLLLAKLGIPLDEAQRSFAGEGCERLRPFSSPACSTQGRRRAEPCMQQSLHSRYCRPRPAPPQMT